MQAFDFDGTLYKGDSSLDFAKYCFMHQPQCFKALPKIVSGAISFSIGRISRKVLKERFFSFLPYVINLEDVVLNFWVSNSRKLNEVAVSKVCAGDVLVSASPEFLLKKQFENLGMILIATLMNPYSARIIGENCRGHEKVKRCIEYGFTEPFEAFYSDSYVDFPMMEFSKKKYLVTGESIEEIF